MEPEGSILNSQELSTCPYPEIIPHSNKIQHTKQKSREVGE
jgi:hypothetical protein